MAESTSLHSTSQAADLLVTGTYRKRESHEDQHAPSKRHRSEVATNVAANMDRGPSTVPSLATAEANNIQSSKQANDDASLPVPVPQVTVDAVVKQVVPKAVMEKPLNSVRPSVRQSVSSDARETATPCTPTSSLLHAAQPCHNVRPLMRQPANLAMSTVHDGRESTPLTSLTQPAPPKHLNLDENVKSLMVIDEEKPNSSSTSIDSSVQMGESVKSLTTVCDRMAGVEPLNPNAVCESSERNEKSNEANGELLELLELLNANSGNQVVVMARQAKSYDHSEHTVASTEEPITIKRMASLLCQSQLEEPAQKSWLMDQLSGDKSINMASSAAVSAPSPSMAIGTSQKAIENGLSSEKEAEQRVEASMKVLLEPNAASDASKSAEKSVGHAISRENSTNEDEEPDKSMTSSDIERQRPEMSLKPTEIIDLTQSVQKSDETSQMPDASQETNKEESSPVQMVHVDQSKSAVGLVEEEKGNREPAKDIESSKSDEKESPERSADEPSMGLLLDRSNVASQENSTVAPLRMTNEDDELEKAISVADIGRQRASMPLKTIAYIDLTEDELDETASEQVASAKETATANIDEKLSPKKIEQKVDATQVEATANANGPTNGSESMDKSNENADVRANEPKDGEERHRLSTVLESNVPTKSNEISLYHVRIHGPTNAATTKSANENNVLARRIALLPAPISVASSIESSKSTGAEAASQVKNYVSTTTKPAVLTGKPTTPTRSIAFNNKSRLKMILQEQRSPASPVNKTQLITILQKQRSPAGSVLPEQSTSTKIQEQLNSKIPRRILCDDKNQWEVANAIVTPKAFAMKAMPPLKPSQCQVDATKVFKILKYTSSSPLASSKINQTIQMSQRLSTNEPGPSRAEPVVVKKQQPLSQQSPSQQPPSRPLLNDQFRSPNPMRRVTAPATATTSQTIRQLVDRNLPHLSLNGTPQFMSQPSHNVQPAANRPNVSATPTPYPSPDAYQMQMDKFNQTLSTLTGHMQHITEKLNTMATKEEGNQSQSQPPPPRSVDPSSMPQLDWSIIVRAETKYELEVTNANLDTPDKIKKFVSINTCIKMINHEKK